jgi:hypothetical protein
MSILNKLKEQTAIAKIKNKSINISEKEIKLLEKQILFGNILEELNETLELEAIYKKD